MKRDELLVELAVARQVLDDKVRLVPKERLRDEVPGFNHSVAELLSHIAAYERLVVNRLESAGHGATTQLQADQYPDRFELSSWHEMDGWKLDNALRRSAANYQAVTKRLREVTDDELAGRIGAGGALDRRWLRGRLPWQAIYDDTAGHYREHEAMLDAACPAAVR